MKRVLVTGATGCIGRHLVPLLAARGWDVHGVSSAAGPDRPAGATWHTADLLDAAQVEALGSRVQATHLVHLAWYIAPGRWAQAPENLAWVRASLALADAFQRHGGHRIVGAGSCLEYDWRYGYCHEERTPRTPHTVYGECKDALHRLLGTLQTTSDVSVAWGRIFFLYGPWEHPDRLVPAVMRALLAGEPAKVSHGRQVRDYLFVEDVASAFAALLESDLRGPINIASGRPIALREIVERIGRLIGRADLVRFGAIPAAATDTPLVVADTTRLSETLGWTPAMDLDAGLERTAAWWTARMRTAAGRA
jgi:nucleoside-diphosphate-sugar epimerase